MNEKLGQFFNSYCLLACVCNTKNEKVSNIEMDSSFRVPIYFVIFALFALGLPVSISAILLLDGSLGKGIYHQVQGGLHVEASC
jgi:hypothetical protein